jgi:anion-transporting  ArsA/GET3 family ATPase
MKELKKSFKNEIDYHRYWKVMYEKEHKLRQEAEGEMSILKTISVHSSPEMREAKEEINELKNKIASLEDTLTSRDYFEKPDYNYLIEENRRLEEESNELRVDNQKLALQIDGYVSRLRKSGVL